MILKGYIGISWWLQDVMLAPKFTEGMVNVLKRIKLNLFYSHTDDTAGDWGKRSENKI